MDSCKDDALKLDYLNGLLSGREKALFEDHLAACPGCRREIVELRKTAAAVAGLTPPPVPAAWTAAAKDRLRAETRSAGAAVPSGPTPARRGTNIFQYALISAGVTGGLVLLLWLAGGGALRRWLPGLPAASPGVSAPRADRMAVLFAWVLSLHSLVFIPSIIDDIYRLVRGENRR